MTLDEFISCIPNRDKIDIHYAKVVFERLIYLKKLMEQLPNEEPYMTAASRYGERPIKNPFFDILKAEESAVRMGLNELNITPKSRKMVNSDDVMGILPKLEG